VGAELETLFHKFPETNDVHAEDRSCRDSAAKEVQVVDVVLISWFDPE
jgi:hypothetical protein